MRINKKFFIPGVIICLYIQVHAQTQYQNKPYNEVSIPSPTAASLGKYGDIPVNYHTGIPQINIPIYTLKNGPLELPVSLSYHASGLKVLEPASWVGAGWALNAGGVITRNVVGGPDEANTLAPEDQGHFSHYGYNSYFSGGGQQQDWNAFGTGHKDGEPDLFFFNFGGYTGKFYFRDDRTPICVPQQDLKIEYYYPADNNSQGFTALGYNIQAFTITTPNGDKYYFGNSPGFSGTPPIESTGVFPDNVWATGSGNSGGSVISSWYLNKITTADNQFSINLSYQPESYGYFTTGMFPITGSSSASVYEYHLVKNIISGVRLSQVSSPNGNINFIANTVRTDLSNDYSYVNDGVNQNAKALDQIQITNGGSLCKNYVFSYGYFTDNSTALTGYYNPSDYNTTLQTDKQRLKLNSVQEISCDNSTSAPPHQFTYFSEQVPRRLTFGMDHWGFYNGAVTNDKLVPTYTVNDGSSITTYNGANRESAWPAMRGGSLQQITYPTGGYTNFEFEPNDVFTSHTEYQSVTRLYMSMGYDGNSSPTTSTLVSDGNAFDMFINAISSVYDEQVTIKNSNNVQVYYGALAYGTSTHVNLTLAAGNYQVTLGMASGGNSSPTGHGVQVTFSQWTYVSVNANTVIGGLRIKTITHNDGLSTQNNIVTSYSYQDGGGISTGVLYSKPMYVQQIRNDIIQNVGYWSVTNGFQPNTLNPNGCPYNALYFKSGGSIRPMDNTQGNHIGYSNVRVAQSGNGYSVYNYYKNSNNYFSTISDVSIRTVVANSGYCDGAAPNFPAAPLPFDPKRGELYYEQHYDNNGQLLKDVYNYPEFNDTTFTTPAFTVFNLSDPSYGSKLLGTFYSLTSPRKTKTVSIETEYSSAGNISKTSTTYYGSSFHNQPTRQEISNSSGDVLATNIKYASDFRIPNCDAIANCSVAYNSSCTSCQSQYSAASSACNGGSSCLTTAYMNYQQCLTNARVSYVSCRRTNYMDPTNSFKTTHDYAKTNYADALLKPILELQDEYNNPAIEVSNFKNTNLTGSAFNIFDYSLNSQNVVHVTKVQSIKLAAASASFTASTNTNGTLSKDSRYDDDATLVYDQSNLVQLTKKDGLVTSFIYGYNSTYPVAKVLGAAYSSIINIPYSSIVQNPSSDQALRDELTNIRTQAPTALVNTYTYSKLVGPSSETDANGKTVYYTYDALGRLSIVRDKDNNILKRICYNYAGQPENCGPPVTYYNAVYNASFTRNNCSSGTVGSSVTYTVPANTYSSIISQADANNKAVADANTNGQAYANANGSCSSNISLTSNNYMAVSGFTAVYTNTATSQQYTFTISSASGTQALGSVPAGTYNISISKTGNTAHFGFYVCNGNCYGDYGNYGTSATFYNILIINQTTCSGLILDDGS